MCEKKVSIRGALTVYLFFAAVAATFAGGTAEPLEATASSQGTIFISPNADGEKEDGSIEFTATVYVKSQDGYIPEYGIRIKDSNGSVVREVVQKT